MKRIARGRTKFDLLQAVDCLVRDKGLPIRDPTSMEAVFDELRKQFVGKQADDIFFHGHRVETLFAYVAASLGGCRVIKVEDAGELYSPTDSLRIPDLRIVTNEGRQLMVEVKNFHTTDPREPFKVKSSYLSGLRDYASTFNSELFFAIYWSRAKQWTLLALEDFNNGPDRLTVTMLEALHRTRMYLLGDRMIATLPILALRLIATPDSGNADGAEGEYLFTTAAAQLYCGKELISDPTEQQIAWFLMMNGRWVYPMPLPNSMARAWRQ